MILNNTTSSSINTNTRANLVKTVGTVSTVVNSNLVTGSSTTFLSDCVTGDSILINNIEKRIVEVISNTQLKVDSVYDVNSSAVSYSIFFEGGVINNHQIITIKSHASNTGILTIGLSRNAQKDGSDVTPILNSIQIAVNECTPFIAIRSLKDLYIQSTVANQRYSLIINSN